MAIFINRYKIIMPPPKVRGVGAHNGVSADPVGVGVGVTDSYSYNIS